MAEAYFMEASPCTDWLRELDLDILVAGRAEHQDRWPGYEEFRGYPYFRLYCVTGGSARLGLPEGERVLSAPGLYLLPAQVPLRYPGGDHFSHLWVHFISRQLGRFEYFQDLHQAEPAGAETALTRMLELLRRGPPGWAEALELDGLLRLLLGRFVVKAPPPTERERRKESAPLAEVVDYIDRHLAEKLTVPALARRCRMSAERFSDAFHAAFQVRPKHYICQRRISAARRLLLTTDLPIKEISRRVGYMNVLFFHRLFRAYAGQTPLDCRRHSHPGL